MRAKAHDYYEQLGGGISSDVLEEGIDARQLQALTEEVSIYQWTIPAFDRICRHSRASYGGYSKLHILGLMQLSKCGCWVGILPIFSIKRLSTGLGYLGFESTSAV